MHTRRSASLILTAILAVSLAACRSGKPATASSPTPTHSPTPTQAQPSLPTLTQAQTSPPAATRTRTAAATWTPTPTFRPVPTRTPTASSTLSATPSPQPASNSEAQWQGSDSLLQAGLRYADAPGDMPASFLDVVAFQATVDEKTGEVIAVFQMRDVPETAEKGHVVNSMEYLWEVKVYLTPPAAQDGEAAPDFSLNVFSFTLDMSTDSPAETPLASSQGTATSVPFAQLNTSSGINDRAGENIASIQVYADPDLDTITLRGKIPGIRGDAHFSFETQSYDGSRDAPDEQITILTPSAPPTEVAGPSQEATATAGPQAANILNPAGKVRGYPGPTYYAGDILTLEILLDQFADDQPGTAVLAVDGGQPFEVQALWRYNVLILPQALDTTGLEGDHVVHITAQGSSESVDMDYRFSVLEAARRPAQEAQAAWLSRSIPCCTLHYIAQTAAARDIDQIAEQVQLAADEFTRLTGKDTQGKMQVYLIDRMWGNGAFGGAGELVVSYTDRYYGPTAGMEALQTLIRHELTHATATDVGKNGFFLYNEGLAVFLAGGHYKPEPLAERGAALFQLGYSIKVGESYPQHEVAYLFGAVVASYVVERYGWDRLWQFVDQASGDAVLNPDGLDAVIQAVFGITLEVFNDEFTAWVKRHDPGAQLEDLRLTIALQDLRREYQDKYAPPPMFIFGKAEEMIAHPENLPALIRESDQPANVVVELMIANAQDAIVAGQFTEAETLIEAIRDTVTTGAIEQPLAAEYLSIIQRLAADGYTTLELHVEGDQASARVTRAEPTIEVIRLHQVNGVWQPDN